MLQAGEAFALHHLELVRGKQWFAQHLPQQAEHSRQRLAFGLDRETHRTDPPASATSAAPATPAPPAAAKTSAERGAEAIQLVAQLLVGKLLRAAQHEFGQETGRWLKALQVFLIAITQSESERRFLAARFLRQQCDLDAFGQFLPQHAGLDARRRRIKFLALGQRVAAFVTHHQRVYVRRRGHGHAFGFFGRDEQTDCPVVALEIFSSGGLNLLRGDLLDAIAV